MNIKGEYIVGKWTNNSVYLNVVVDSSFKFKHLKNKKNKTDR